MSPYHSGFLIKVFQANKYFTALLTLINQTCNAIKNQIILARFVFHINLH